MFSRSTLTGAVLALCATSSHAFVTLPTTSPLRVEGSNNIEADPLFITQGDFIVPGDPLGGFNLPSNFELISAIRETDIELPDEDTGELEEVGEFFDAVFRDTNDNKLVFASRIVMDPTEEGEINDIFRAGFNGWEAAVGWTFVTVNDLRLFSAARTGNSGIDESDAFDGNLVGLSTDVNVEELNPQTGWFFIKTDAPSFLLSQNAIQLFQAGEEDQLPFRFAIEGYAPVPVPAALPLLLSGLGVLALRRRRAS